MSGGGSAPASMAKSTIRLGTAIRNELPINKLFRANFENFIQPEKAHVCHHE